MAEDKSYRKTARLELEFPKIHDEDYLEASYKKLLLRLVDVNVLLQLNQG